MSRFCQNQKQKVLKFQIHSWSFCPRELILFPLLSCIFCTFPCQWFIIKWDNFAYEWHSSAQWQVFFSTTFKQLKPLAAFSRLSYPHLATELGFYLVTAFFTFYLFLFSKLHRTYTHSVVFFSYTINTSFVTSIPRPSCAPHQLPPHLSPSLILTQILSCHLYQLFRFSLLLLYLNHPIFGHTTVCL